VHDENIFNSVRTATASTMGANVEESRTKARKDLTRAWHAAAQRLLDAGYEQSDIYDTMRRSLLTEAHQITPRRKPTWLLSAPGRFARAYRPTGLGTPS
jgi:hypothetical protein